MISDVIPDLTWWGLAALLVGYAFGVLAGYLVWHRAPRRHPGGALGSTGAHQVVPPTREEVEGLRRDLADVIADVSEVVTAVEALVPHRHLADLERTPVPGCPQCHWTSGHAPGCPTLTPSAPPKPPPGPGAGGEHPATRSRCPEPHGTFQCVLPAGHTGRHQEHPATRRAPERAPDDTGRPMGEHHPSPGPDYPLTPR